MTEPIATPAAVDAMPTTGPLVDRYGRVFDYIRIAVTEQCNLRCVYCMPEEGLDFAPDDKLLTADEIARVVEALRTTGLGKIRFTGGEPLVRRDMTEIVSRVGGIEGIEDIHLTTNGLLLHRHADALRTAGLNGINISLDTLDPNRFERISRRKGLDRVLSAIDLALETGFPSVKVNVVAMRDFNQDEIGAFCELTRTRPITVRFIELMPFDSKQIWRTGKFFAADWIREELAALHPDLGDDSGSRTEQYVFRLPDHAGKVAVIPAYTRSLCGECNRVRLTADGRIRNCLYGEDEFDLRDILRDGGGPGDIVTLFRRAIWTKHVDGWAAQKAGRTDDGDARQSMTQIGG